MASGHITDGTAYCVCGETVEECNWHADHPICPSCKDIITGARWGSRGECLDCYENRLLPSPCTPGCEEYCPHS